MTMKIGALAFAVAFVSPLASLAQDFSGEVTLGFSRSNYDTLPGLDVDALTFDGRFHVALAEGWSVGARYNSFDQDYGEEFGFFGNLMGFEVDYQINETFTVGAYMEHYGIGGKSGPYRISDVITMRSVGIEGHYTIDNLKIGAHFGATQPGGGMLADANVDATDIGLSFNYDVNEKLLVGGSVVRTNFSQDDFADGHMTVSGIAAVYRATDEINMFGGLARISGNGTNFSDSTLSLGGTYDLSASMGMPLVASLELARTKSDMLAEGENIDSVRLGLTIPIGKGKVQAPLNSSVDAILNPTRTAYSQWFLSY